ncbi:MAG: helix-turn-helix transcriptional regulator [Cognatishimia sp.]
MSDLDNAVENGIGEPVFPGVGEYLTPTEVSELVGLTVATLRDYRSKRCAHLGPPFHKDGHKVFYHLSEVLMWMDNRNSTSKEVR